MTDFLLKAFVTGLMLSILPGPIFFVLLETSIRKGIRSAIALDVGVLLSDLVYIAIAYIFFSQVQAIQEGSDRHIVSLIGGILFTIYGVINFFKKVQAHSVQAIGTNSNSLKDYGLLTLKGFLLNFANPLVIFYWFSILTLGNNGTGGSALGFISITLAVFFGIDLLKIAGAKQLQPLVTNRLLKALNQLIGIVFFLFGVFLIFQGIRGK